LSTTTRPCSGPLLASCVRPAGARVEADDRRAVGGVVDGGPGGREDEGGDAVRERAERLDGLHGPSPERIVHEEVVSPCVRGGGDPDRARRSAGWRVAEAGSSCLSSMTARRRRRAGANRHPQRGSAGDACPEARGASRAALLHRPVRSRCSHPGQQHGRRWPSSNSSWVLRMRRFRVISCFASSTQQMNSLRAKGVMSLQAASAVEFALSASRRSLGRSWTTPPGTRLPLTEKRGAQAPFRGQVTRSRARRCYIRRSRRG
jgi:hypothetical protein